MGLCDRSVHQDLWNLKLPMVYPLIQEANLTLEAVVSSQSWASYFGLSVSL